MTGIQKFFKVILPKRWAEDMEADSKTWMVRCECGYAQSIWDIGGIRWRAKGNPRTFRRCPQCGKTTWQKISK